MSETLFVLIVALALDWYFGEPDWLWGRVPHPVIAMGNLIGWLDRKLNRTPENRTAAGRDGALAFVVMVSAGFAAAWLIGVAVQFFGPVGVLIEIALVFTLLAQKSLKDHVEAVAVALRHGGLEAGREAVSMIVGRDPQQLDRPGVARAAIESLAENFSDGVVAPAFWYAVFGLPGLVVYKIINTADSMIGHRSERYLHFGRLAAITDDAANWLPARLSAALIAAGAMLSSGMVVALRAINVAMADAGLHRSPNAGWPEAAMAGALDIRLGGPRVYAEETVQQAWLNAAGNHVQGRGDIEAALGLFARACLALGGLCGLALLFSLGG